MALFNDVPVLMQSSLKIRPECMQRTERELWTDSALPPTSRICCGGLGLFCEFSGTS